MYQINRIARYVTLRNSLILGFALIGLMILLYLLLFPPDTGSAQTIRVQSATVRPTIGLNETAESPPSDATTSAIYMIIENTRDEDVTLVAAQTNAAADTQLHQTIIEGDVARMEALPDGIVIPAGEIVSLAPGNQHIMLMSLPQHLRTGDEIAVTLTFDDGTTITQNAVVE